MAERERPGVLAKKAAPPSGSALLQFPDELVFVRKFAGLVFRIDQRAIDVHVEDAAGPFNQECLVAERFFDLGSQTDRFWLVASGSAVGNGDVQRHVLALGRYRIR